MDLTKNCDMTAVGVGSGKRERSSRTKFQLSVVGIQQVMIKVKNQEITMNIYFF